MGIVVVIGIDDKEELDSLDDVNEDLVENLVENEYNNIYSEMMRIAFNYKNQYNKFNQNNKLNENFKECKKPNSVSSSPIPIPKSYKK